MTGRSFIPLLFITMDANLWRRAWNDPRWQATDAVEKKPTPQQLDALLNEPGVLGK